MRLIYVAGLIAIIPFCFTACAEFHPERVDLDAYNRGIQQMRGPQFQPMQPIGQQQQICTYRPDGYGNVVRTCN